MPKSCILNISPDFFVNEKSFEFDFFLLIFAACPTPLWGPCEAILEDGLVIFLERVGQRIVDDDVDGNIDDDHYNTDSNDDNNNDNV